MVAMADALVVAVFDDEKTAWDAVVAASAIAAQGKLGLHDACLVVRDGDGNVHKRETHDISTTKAGWYGGAWGLLGGAILGFPIALAAAGAGLGAFMARRRDLGITESFEQRSHSGSTRGRRPRSSSSTTSTPHRSRAPRVGGAHGRRP
jgi:uncharacterized membrane protein